MKKLILIIFVIGIMFSGCKSPMDPKIEEALLPAIHVSPVVDVLESAILEISLYPEHPIFNYNAVSGTTLAYFNVIVTDINGVGGEIGKLIISEYENWQVLSSHEQHVLGSTNGDFEPHSTISIECTVYVKGVPDSVRIYIEGIDNHSYRFSQFFWYYIK